MLLSVYGDVHCGFCDLMGRFLNLLEVILGPKSKELFLKMKLEIVAQNQSFFSHVNGQYITEY
jgi:hypothetical protein